MNEEYEEFVWQNQFNQPNSSSQASPTRDVRRKPGATKVSKARIAKATLAAAIKK